MSRGFLSGGLCPGVFCPGGFYPDTICHYQNWVIHNFC